MSHCKDTTTTTQLPQQVIDKRGTAADGYAEDDAVRQAERTAITQDVMDITDRSDLLQQHSNHSLEPIGLDTSLVTSGYLTTLNNRLILHKILPDSELDMRKYPPAFVHDILMLPGTLAHTLGKGPECDIMDRLTPAILPGFRAVVSADTKGPLLVRTGNIQDFVRGIIIFGQGKIQRSLIHEHYRARGIERMKADAIIETRVPIPRASRSQDGNRWATQRTAIKTDVWAWTKSDKEDLPEMADWTLDGYMSGKYAD